MSGLQMNSPTFRSNGNLPPRNPFGYGEIIGPSVHVPPTLKNCRSSCSLCFQTSHLSRISTSRGYPVFLREFSPHTQQQIMYKRRRMANVQPAMRSVKAPLTHQQSESMHIFIQTGSEMGSMMRSTAASTDHSFASKLSPKAFFGK